MDDQTMRDALRPLARTIVNPTEQRSLSNIISAFQRDGGLKPSALRRSLPPLVMSWYLPGAIANGSNVGAEIPLTGDIRITNMAIRAKTAPTAQCSVRLTANGAEVEKATIQTGQAAGQSTVRGEQAVRLAGEVLRLDVVSAGGAGDVTVTISYTAAD